jgi:hypothetical protein
MLIKNFVNPTHSIEDINNIPERRRFVVIYKYPDGPHKTLYEIYQNDIYDLYLINTSTVVGKDYIIPQGMVVQYKNTYRGKVFNPYNSNGFFNQNALCVFNNSSFVTRIVNGKEIIRLSKKDVLCDGTYENYISNLTKSNTITPFPIYYNIEDQAHLAKGDYQKMDFELFLNDVPQYTLNDFVEKKTTFISVSIHEDNVFQNETNISQIMSINNPQDSYNKFMVDTVKDQFMDAFLTCYDIVSQSIFAQAYIVLDIDSGLMNVPKDYLTLKHSYNITKDEINVEYMLLLQKIEEVSLNLCDTFSTDYINDNIIPFTKIPEKVMFYVSPTLCKIKFFTSNQKQIFEEKVSGEYSVSDIEESSFCKEFSETMYPSEYITEEDDEYDIRSL